MVWLIHQFRQAYREYGSSRRTPRARAVHRLDRATLSEAQRLFAISENVASRLEKSVGL